MAILIGGLSLADVGCSERSTAPGAAPHALLGLSANPSDFTYADSALGALRIARATGAELQVHTPLWSEIEQSPTAIDLSQVRFWFDLYRFLGFQPYLNVRLLDTVSRGVPADLAATPFDDPAMIARVDELVDSLANIARVYPLAVLALGNEVDAYFSIYPGDFPAFRALYRRAADRLRSSVPGVRVGICATHPLGNPNAHYADTLNTASDVLVYTYYPFQPASDFQHRPSSDVDVDLEAIRVRAAGRPIAFQEVGYASSAGAGSTTLAQADAVGRFRRWLSRQDGRQVVFANWFLLTDWSSPTLVALFAYYGASTPGFAAFLGSLGLRDTTGVAKPAWDTWRSGG
jgi:hypothetical protein